MILYLHGFRSSPHSTKAMLLAQAMRERGLADQWLCPQLPASPATAMEQAMHLIRQAQQRGLHPERDLTVIGSSLGGYYATCLAEYWKCRAALLNPAVYAARDLATQVGEHLMYHSDAPFLFLPEHVDELAEMAVGKPAHPERYYLLAAKGDEVLDWREMVDWFSGSQMRILEGSDHGLSDFSQWLPEVLDFALGALPSDQARTSLS
ncbi:YqiA/YcfP family alpha/beta fold hydrolase [Allopusillimonas ginsengisoli]|uniref:YqiA/YcfP family alpha/beta fold hydrolase n=1 Tax=Allopusillimonas ginsengisoli TaxID=453575 RepID=UPI001021A4E2|nr:YqiA/YcfP family alpha/beta fold hydrolase [Allopusillimonas ginsengisoli]TEA79092.1 esterase [Allopusillimonas ginsengisoli]